MEIRSNKNVWKVLLCCLLCCTFLLSVLQISAKAESYKAGGDCGKDLKWSLDYDGNLYIYGDGKMYDYGFFDYGNHLPWEEYKAEIKTVTMEKGITYIGRAAFYGCTAIERVALPKSGITQIASDAFRDCSSLSDITLPKGLEKIGSHSFFGCKALTSITFPDTLKNLGADGANQYAFGSSGLTSVTIPSNVTEMGAYCFKDCTDLKSVYIDGTNLEVGYEAFMGCTSLNVVKMGNGVTKMRQEAFRGCVELEEVTLGKNLTELKGQDFQDCISLKEIVIPDKVQIIQCYESSGVFKNCTALEKVTLGVGVSEIGDYAFDNCTALKEVYFCGEAPTFNGTNTFKGCGMLNGYYPETSKTWDRSTLTSHGAERIDWNKWQVPLTHFTPVLKSVKSVNSGVTVTWKKLAGANGYEVWKKTGNGAWTLAQTIAKAATVSWTDKAVGNGNRYTYRVIAISTDEKSKVSNSLALYYLTKPTPKVSAKAAGILVKWNKNASANGYQVQFATNKGFTKNKKTVTVKKAKTVSTTWKKGTKGKTYYVRVRTYKTVNGKKYYSIWSVVKKVKAK